MHTRQIIERYTDLCDAVSNWIWSCLHILGESLRRTLGISTNSTSCSGGCHCILLHSRGDYFAALGAVVPTCFGRKHPKSCFVTRGKCRGVSPAHCEGLDEDSHAPFIYANPVAIWHDWSGRAYLTVNALELATHICTRNRQLIDSDSVIIDMTVHMPEQIVTRSADSTIFRRFIVALILRVTSRIKNQLTMLAKRNFRIVLYAFCALAAFANHQWQLVSR